MESTYNLNIKQLITLCKDFQLDYGDKLVCHDIAYVELWLKTHNIPQNDITLKTSDQWLDLINAGKCVGKLVIVNADGWDRDNFYYSFYDEKITREEFDMRVSRSTIYFDYPYTP